MIRHPAPTRQDHQHFCEFEGWVRIRTAAGKAGTHPITYELTLPDGRVLRTRISHPPDHSAYGKGLWRHILTDQLQVTEDSFLSCVRDGLKPDRGSPAAPPENALPASLVYQLVVRFGVPEQDVASMTKQQAIERLATLWSQAAD